MKRRRILLTISALLPLTIVSLVFNDINRERLYATEKIYSLKLDANNNSTDFNGSSYKTYSSTYGEVNFSYSSLSSFSGGYATMGNNGYLFNNDPINGLKDITVYFTSSLYVDFGFSSNDLSYTYSLNSGVLFDFYGKTPTYFKLYTLNNSSSITSISVNYNCLIGKLGWYLVNDESTLAIGDKLVMGATKDSNSFTAGSISSSVMASVDTTINNGVICNLPNETVQLTLGSSDGAYTLANSNGQLLGVTSTKKVAFGNGTTTWNISIEEGVATIQSTTESLGRFLYNVSSPRFTTYTSDTNVSMLLPSLYVYGVGATGTGGGLDEPSTNEPSSETPSYSEEPSSEVPSSSEPSSSEVSGYTTVTQNSFSTVSGNLDNNSNITYTSYKGDGTTAPAVYSNAIRLYQNNDGGPGGYITLEALNGCTIISATIGSSTATTIKYTLDDDTTYSEEIALAANSTYTLEPIEVSKVTFYCYGTSTSTRLNVNYLSVTYVGEGEISSSSEPSSSETPSSEEPSSSEPTHTGNSYYDDITATSGNALLGQVRDLIINTHTTYTSYGQCRGGDEGYAGISDPDPNKEGNIIMLYTQASITDCWDANIWNREHVWCQSLSNGLWEDVNNSDTSGGADMHHIRPCFYGVNSSRGSKKYGEVTNGTVKTYTYSGVTYDAGYYDSTCWEPLDNVKGDVARILLYVFTHYNTASNLLTNTNKTGSLNSNATNSRCGSLPITEIVSASSKAEAFALLVEWNNLDPVDDIEIARNNGVYTIQGNRNPFIDHPEYVSAIWG